MKNSPKKSRVLANNFYALRWLLRISPGFTLYRMLDGIVGSVIILFEHVYLVAFVISCIENNRPLRDALWFIIPVTAGIVIRFVIGYFVDSYIQPKKKEHINREIQFALYRKAVGMDIQKYDNPDFYNDFVWAMREAPAHLEEARNNIGDLVRVILITALVGTFVIANDPVSVAVILVMVVITLFSRFRLNKLQMERLNKIVPEKRKRDYIHRVFYLADYAKELRTSEIKEKLYDDFDEASAAMESHVTEYGKKLTLLSYVTNVVQKVLTMDGIYLSYLLYQTFVRQSFGYGTLIALYNSSRNLKGSIEGLVEMGPRFQNQSMYIERLRTFLDAENELKDEGTAVVPDVGDISLDNVSFAYPGSDTKILKNISLHIRKGEKIALVGYNGAGKSTLVKLLMRLYDPSEGVVCYDNLPLGDYPLAELRKHFGVVFQESEVIAASLAENITMSGAPIDAERALQALEKSGFRERFESFENGFETRLTKEFDNQGVNLSGGEAQKVALSRTLYSDSSVLILDEPSSALDPVAEYRINQTMLHIAEDKTVVIITHRLSTTKFVDKIYMMEDGRIVESGSHDSLMELGGKYAEMFNLQAAKYR